MRPHRVIGLFASVAVVAVIIFGIYSFSRLPGSTVLHANERLLPSDVVIDSLVLHKSKRELRAYSHGHLVKTYSVALGKQPVGHKQFEGDSRTPEGLYRINDKNPHSDYHKNLGISYPRSEDIAAAERVGRSAGGEIKIHGLRNGTGMLGKLHRYRDWTAGCVAVTDEEIDELYAAVVIHSPILIKP